LREIVENIKIFRSFRTSAAGVRMRADCTLCCL